MPVRLEPEATFERSSPVCDYWLTRCAGFQVVTPDGRKGRVEAAVYEPSRSRVSHVFVRFRWRRDAAVVPAEEVEAVVPAERLLVMGRSAPSAEGGVPSDSARVAGLGHRVARAATRAAAWTAPRTGRLGRAAARGLAAVSRLPHPGAGVLRLERQRSKKGANVVGLGLLLFVVGLVLWLVGVLPGIGWALMAIGAILAIVGLIMGAVWSFSRAPRGGRTYV